MLHGLTAVADVWGPTVACLQPRPTCRALDQRGHGESHPERGGWTIAAYVRDACEYIAQAGSARPHLVGHSMGARVAMVLAAQHPELIRSVAIVEIGPEQWKANWENSITAFDALPDSFVDEAAALKFAGSRTASSPVGTGMFLARLRPAPGGGLTWRADREALRATVRSHRSRNFWRQWESIGVPALFVRGGTSYEVRLRIAKEMRRRNPEVEWAELEGVSHNVPLIAPERLARTLCQFWATHP